MRCDYGSSEYLKQKISATCIDLPLDFYVLPLPAGPALRITVMPIMCVI